MSDMQRISKAPEERKEEIVTTAQRLFLQKGFTKTKISDIVKAIDVSQGVFYYYFPSKAAVIDEILDRYMNLHLTAARTILADGTLNPLEKMERMAEAQQAINNRENQNIHLIKGVDIHEKIIYRLITDYVPLMVDAFGGEKGVQADLKIELFVAAANILFDPGLFHWTKEERNRRVDFVISLMEQDLNLPKGSFRFYRGLMGYTE